MPNLRALATKLLLRCVGSILFLALPPLSANSQCQRVRVAAASDLQGVMPQLVSEFEKGPPHKSVNVSYGSSGNFFAQIQNGAPFDLFFSADVDYAKKLQESNRAYPDKIREYAIGRIALWAPRDSTLNLQRDTWNALLNNSVHTVAIANPDHAPYGRAAIAALKSAGIYEQVKAKLVYGENISQAAQFVQSGNASVGILALSLALSPALASGQRWDIPQESYPPIVQAAVLLKTNCYPESADSFLQFVTSARAKPILEKFGFQTPPDK